MKFHYSIYGLNPAHRIFCVVSLWIPNTSTKIQTFGTEFMLTVPEK